MKLSSKSLLLWALYYFYFTFLINLETVDSLNHKLSRSLSISNPRSLRKPIITSMTLVPISSTDIRRITSTGVTTEQWKSYWGMNRIDRLQKVMESFLMSYGGAWLAWFLSFMAGNFIAAIVGSLMIFNWMYSPVSELQF